MTVISLLFDSRRDVGVWVAFDSRPALHGGAAVHRLVITVTIDARNTLPVGTVIDLDGSVWLGTSVSRDYLGRWTTDNPAVIRKDPFTEQLVFDLPNDQLALIERRRLAGDGTVRLDFEINASLPAGLAATAFPDDGDSEPAKPLSVAEGAWPQAHRNHHVFISAAQWTEMLAGVNTHAAMAIIVPLPLLDNDARDIGNVLREALELIAAGKPDKAVIDARRVIEILDSAFGDLNTSKAQIKAIADVTAEQRTQEQRFALLRHALFSVASPPAHGDPHARAFTWRQDNAMTVLAAVAALAVLRSDAQP